MGGLQGASSVSAITQSTAEQPVMPLSPGRRCKSYSVPDKKNDDSPRGRILAPWRAPILKTRKYQT